MRERNPIQWRLFIGLCRLLVCALVCGAGIGSAIHAQSATPKQDVPVTCGLYLWSGQSGNVSATDPVIKLMKQRPDIKVSEWAGITLPGAGGRTPLLLSIAGQTSPDLYYCWFHIVRSDINQRFLRPLDDWIGTDKNGNGQIEPSEAKWSGWKNVDPLWRQVATVDGHVYGIPLSSTNYMGIIFRTDLVRAAGLNPNKTPKTWDEFMYWCQRLTDPKKGRKAFALPSYGFTWLPWLNSTGGTPVIQERTSPTTGKVYPFPMEATSFITPDTHEDLMKEPSVWRAALASESAKRAMEFYHRLRWQKWMKDPLNNEPINLTAAEVKAHKVTLPTGRVVRFKDGDVITGVILSFGGQASTVDWTSELRRGNVAAVQWFFTDLSSYQQQVGIDPNLLGVFPVPAGPGGKPVVQLQRHFGVMTEGVKRRSKYEQDIIWKVLTTIASPEAHDETVRNLVISGKARFANPKDLKRLGYESYIKEIPQTLKDLYAGIDTGEVITRTEPFMGYWVSMDTAINNEVVSLTLSDSGEHFNYNRALDEVNRKANNGTMFSRSPQDIAKHRPIAWIIFCIVAAIMAFFVFLIVRSNLSQAVEASEMTTATVVVKKKGKGSRAGVYTAWMPWLMLFPALGLIALWGYYPLARGMVMAFQDYHIVGKSLWVGLDNFINIFLDPDYALYVILTLKFVLINMLLVFTAPIVLALLLSEIPWGKVFWRSVFFLPQLTSGLVVALIWKLMYSPADAGLLNQMISLFGMKAIDWLNDPKYAMIATIIPSVWAGMGISSLIYLAALKGIPDELYEAAALDGAGVWGKLRFVTIPQLMPLIIINFIGAFIGTFQSMGNIFLLTFGGPGKSTMVMGMAIWIEAFANLRFSIATAMAWVLGAALISFAYLQIRILRKVEFRRVEEN